MASVKIISWNVNGIRACAKKGLTEFIELESPDFLCLQEVKAFKEQAQDLPRSKHLSHEVWHSAEKPGYSGVMTATRKVEASVATTLGMGIKDFDREGRVLVSDLGSAYLMNMYFPNGAMSETRHLFKMRFLSEILNFFVKMDRLKPLILTGDFNIAHKAIDIHDPVRLDGTSGFKPEERAWMDQFVEAGFIDAFRFFQPEAKEAYSWWSYRQMSRERNKGWRIDYFFVSKRLAPSLRDFKMHQKVQGSDHCPVSLVIDLN